MKLPPGQRRIDGFPRFGTHLGRPAPAVPADPVIEISGAVTESFALPLATLATLPRRELTADFHCVAGWSATDLHWEGVAIEDALADDVLIVEHLDGRPLDGDHGAPARLVSPSQYGYISTKHLCRISLHTADPREVHAAHPISKVVLLGPLVMPHPRARVWEEERHPHLPARLLRRLYRLTIPVGVFLGARGSRRSRA